MESSAQYVALYRTMARRNESMFSVAEKRKIAESVERTLLDLEHPEMPESKPDFTLKVKGKEEWSWADIRPNWVFDEGKETPGINPWNEVAREVMSPQNILYQINKDTKVIMVKGQGSGYFRYGDIEKEFKDQYLIVLMDPHGGVAVLTMTSGLRPLCYIDTGADIALARNLADAEVEVTATSPDGREILVTITKEDLV
jgi:hypothetical protein